MSSNLRHSLIKNLQVSAARGRPMDLAMQDAHGVSAFLAAKHARSGWLKLLSQCASVKTVRLFLLWTRETEVLNVSALREKYPLPAGSSSRWMGRLADKVFDETATPIWEQLSAIGKSAPEGTWDSVPTDLSIRLGLVDDCGACPRQGVGDDQ